MGGFGSGNHGGRRKVESMLKLDVRDLFKDGKAQRGAVATMAWNRGVGREAEIGIFVGSDHVVLSSRPNPTTPANGKRSSRPSTLSAPRATSAAPALVPVSRLWTQGCVPVWRPGVLMSRLS